MSYRIEPLSEGHGFDAFCCGQADLDEWLKEHARHATRQGTRTYVLLDEGSGAVDGYFAVAPHLVERDELPRRVGRGAPTMIPAVLLAKLALDERLHGRGLGADLLVHALTVIIGAARTAGGRLVVVDAVDDDAGGFYRAHDFQLLPSNPRRLVMKLSTAARALGLPWP